jgi:hypothetical protein
VTPPESPSSLLERAAQRLERLAEHFGGYQQAATEEPDRVGSPVTWWAYDNVDRNALRAGKLWIETMSPAVARPLAQWLRSSARYIHFERGAVSSEESGRDFFEGKYGGAFELSRLILGEPVPGEDE